MPDLSGRVAIVTGGTKGIGRAVAESILDAGADVVISSRTGEEVGRVAAELQGRGGGELLGRSCDVREPEECRALVDAAVERFGRLDILVNNAGVGRFAPVPEMSVDDWRVQIDTNLSGVFYCSKAALPHLSETGDGWIVNVGSLAGKNPFSGGAAYNASKFGLVGLTEAMMLDVRHDDVRVSLVMPGSVDTWFNDRDPANSPRAWAQKPEDVALAVLGLFDQPLRTHVSRIEMRPSQPPKS
ncbi:MAG: SDR family oxidoreductase [Gemmatimonadetes bacterium]|nr:SDR family oxidoreductase [Gemmatimonadota bacterium]NIR78352.1 SDR family oxidoreductase [Gemmatimonadota bacterium]NIT85947.1 SDR family oxidoreductase [Gemmatimonadota bacterium]NIU29767.1 SDR family oxidoreductase [Gemmatimonadota bacterium]NIU37956.1 SDR family oxidoreductase [Gemmatimonadota bacterium]